jgi:hypothetical protein
VTPQKGHCIVRLPTVRTRPRVPKRMITWRAYDVPGSALNHGVVAFLIDMTRANSAPPQPCSRHRPVPDGTRPRGVQHE